MAETLAQALVELFQDKIPPELTAFFISLLPILELRGGMIAARLLEINFFKAFADSPARHRRMDGCFNGGAFGYRYETLASDYCIGRVYCGLDYVLLHLRHFLHGIKNKYTSAYQSLILIRLFQRSASI